MFPQSAKYIHLDIDSQEIGRNYEALRLAGDAKLTLAALDQALSTLDLSKRREGRAAVEQRIAAARRSFTTEAQAVMHSDAVPIRPERLMLELNKVLRPDSVVVTDASYAPIWAANYLTAQRAGMRFLAGRGLAGLGWGLPAAIGAKLAVAEREVFCITGDGGFAHVWSELETARRLGIKVIVIVLNYNRAEDTIECIASVKASDYGNLEIVFVDNGSADDSEKRVMAAHPNVELIQNGENLGYAEGNNMGIRYALTLGADYVFVLNNDTTVEKGTIRRLVDVAEANSLATIVAPKALYYDRRDTVNSCGTTMDWPRLRPYVGECGQKDDGRFGGIKEKEILPGSALLMKRRLFGEVGFFDKRYFLIHEDADLCLRNLKKGFKNVLAADAVIHHKAAKTLSSYPFLTQYYSTRNFLYLAREHATASQRTACMAGLLLLSLKRLAVYPFLRGTSKSSCAGFLKGTTDYFSGIRGRFEGKT